MLLGLSLPANELLALALLQLFERLAKDNFDAGNIRHLTKHLACERQSPPAVGFAQLVDVCICDSGNIALDNSFQRIYEAFVH